MSERNLIVYADGAIRKGATGVAVVIKDGRGRVIGWRSRRLQQEMTCTEAEYMALLLALEVVQGYRPQAVNFCLDSQVVVNQMRGVFATRHPRLQLLNGRAREMTAGLPRVTFTHVPRQRNRLADALAQDAVEGNGDERSR